MPFSHKRHAPLRLPCASCHQGAQKTERAGYPGVSNCMVCHQSVKREAPAIERLAALPADAKPFPTGKARRLPDFVFFSHAQHAAGGATCVACHGSVLEQDARPEQAPRKMKACVDCHLKHEATVVCTACHELNQ
jgi:Zn-finger protein